MNLIILLFGFPAVFVSLLVSALGVHKEKYWLVLLGAVLFIPFSYYLSGAPGLYRAPILLPLFQVLAAAAVRENNKRWAWILLIPAFLATLWVIGVALFYQIR
ncbi:MAG: hypothetical protein C3F07_01675 [Anaerolineales bacterium]|nr:hypothetical protein [Anaerolineae bacterium]PWB77668.1 MAG: hypothetical protein C3F07_01675 [Anaerolineales bacterium]